MENQDKKNQFILARARGDSYSTIAKALNISKGTCTKWGRELDHEISARREEQLEDLYSAYYMTKEARIKQLGETLNKVNKALESKDLEDLPPEKLLDFKLKLIQSLKEEYIPPVAARSMTTGEPDEIAEQYADLIQRIRTGEITTERAKAEIAALSASLKAYEDTRLKEQVDALGTILERR